MNLHINQYLSAYDSCSKPCTEVTYTFSAEPFTAMTDEELLEQSKCTWRPGLSLLAVRFNRRILYEYVSIRNNSSLILP